ncbi:MAG: ComEC/Rec2 family competence protein [Bacteroidota bacterium]
MLTLYRPFLGIGCAFALGICLSPGLPTFFGFLLLIPLVPAVVLFCQPTLTRHPHFQNAFQICALVAFSGLGFLLHHSQTIRPANAIGHFIGKTVVLEGQPLMDSRPTKYGAKVTVECEGVFSGKIMLYLPEGMEAKAGAHVAGDVRVKALKSKFPGYLRWLEQQGIYATGSVMHDFQVTESVSGWRGWAGLLRTYAGDRMAEAAKGSNMVGLSQAMLLGDRTELAAETRSDFQKAGLSHVLAISGMHVGIVFLGLNSLLSFLAYSPTRRRIRFFIIMTLLLIYMMVTGCSPAVCRAVLMIGMLQFGTVFFRQSDRFNLLALSALILLLSDPSLLFQLGFQLSYAAVAGIMLISKPLALRIHSTFPRCPKSFAETLAVCIAAQCATAPLIWIHFEQFPTWFLLSNILILPFVSVAMNMGFLGLMLCWVPGVGEALFGMMDFVMSIVGLLSNWIAAFPAAVVERLSFRDPGFVVVFMMAATALFVLHQKTLREEVRRMRFSFSFNLRRQMAWTPVAGMMAFAVVGMV